MEILYLCLVASLITVEHYSFGRLWKEYELARWVMGIVTIMGLVLLVAIDLRTWLLILAGFGIGGAIKVSLVLSEHANTRRKEVTEIREQIKHGG